MQYRTPNMETASEFGNTMSYHKFLQMFPVWESGTVSADILYFHIIWPDTQYFLSSKYKSTSVPS